MTKTFVGQLISEAMAMFIIIAFGDSVAAMYTLYNPSPLSASVLGSLYCVGAGGHACHLYDGFGERLPR